MNVKIREQRKLNFGRHWIIAIDGQIVADIWGKPTACQVVVRSQALPHYTGPKVRTYPSLAEAESGFAQGWRAA